MRYFLSFFVFLTLFILPKEHVFAASDIVISEILIGQEKASDAHEFVELYNTSSASIDISDFRLRYRNSKGTESSLAVLKSGSCIPPQGYFLWANSKGSYAPLADIVTATTLTENYTVLLYPPTAIGDAPLDSVAWGTDALPPKPPVQESLSRDLADLSWLVTRTTPTPTKSTPCPEPDPIPAPSTVRLSEVFPNPFEDESAQEFIELYNSGEEEANISGLILRDASQSGSYTLPKDTLIPAHSYLAIFGNVSHIALNNTEETVSLLDPTGVLIDSLRYETTKEGVSLNVADKGFRGGVPTPGASNQLNALPETKEKVPKEGYRGMPVAFDARGKDADGSPLKYTWDFGDGHKSYLGKTSHTYEENGMYQVTLKTTDGSDDVIETFSIKISSFPKLDIRITSLVPNPAGKDSENEWLVIENREKKTIDLEGWSIATGWDNMVNHPIREHLVVGAKSQVKLTREFSLFTLPNKKGRIELRAPNGKVLQEIEYKEEKSIPEDAVYYKEKGKRWSWKKKAEENVATPTISESALSETETAPQEILEVSPLESSVLPEEKSTDPKAAHLQTIDQETLRREFYRLLHQHAWVDVSNTPSPKSFSPSPSSLLLKLRSLLSQTNATLNDWQNEK